MLQKEKTKTSNGTDEEKSLRKRTTEAMTAAAATTDAMATEEAETGTSIVTLKEKEVTDNAASKKS